MENPFVISGRIPEENFCDREKETDRIIRLLTNGHNILLISQRRMGKTGIIYHCFDRPEIRDNFTTIFVDILQTSSLQEFTFLLGKAVYDALKPKGLRLLGSFVETLRSLSGRFTYDAVTGAPSFSIQLGDIISPQYTLDEIFDFIEKSNVDCVLAIDEFQQISMYPEKNVEAILRTRIQRCNNCRFIFSGSQQHLMAEMFFYPSRPFYNSTSVLYLEAIPKEVYIDFAKRQFARFGKRIDGVEVEKVYDSFGGTTFYLQSMMNMSFFLTGAGGNCTEDILEKSLDEILEASAGLYREILSSLKIQQKEVLLAIAREEPAAGITSGEFLARNGLRTASMVQAAVKKLLERNLVVKIEGRYSLSDKFFSIWLKRVY